jgi:tyrosyl-tRNA synthetase
MSFAAVDRQMEVLREGTEQILTEDELRQKLERSRREGRPLRVKQGFDPTAPDIHLGHTVGLRVLERFQTLGHHVVLIVGDYTAMVGDPSGRKETRPRLSRQEILENAKTYQAQFFKILDPARCELRFNGEWFAGMNLESLLELTSRFTVARMLERDDFRERFQGGAPIGIHEFLYPLMQGYDSVMVRADVEIGATEQTFNLLAARSIQRDYGQEPQVALTFPILPGLDGVRRMSKSLGNYAGITEAPEQMYGKVMSIPDDVLPTYIRLISGWPSATQLEAVAGAATDPMAWKARLALGIVERYHGSAAARSAEEHFDRVVRRKESPDEIPERTVVPWASTLWIPRLLKECALAPSTSEARRLIESGGVFVDGNRVTDATTALPADPERVYMLKVGKRRFLRLRIAKA